MMGFEAMNWMVIAGLGVAFAIAWITPFDRAFAAATFGIPLLRGVDSPATKSPAPACICCCSRC
ncbi:MAG TPA: hypothetical protein VIC25_02335 [Caulobacteraceae bacterium]|jgi:hypothetical protein